MRHGATEQAEDPGVGRHRQGTTRPTFLNLAQRRRRTGSRIPTGFDFEANSGLEHSHGCLPRSGALFGLNCCGTRSPTNNTTEGPTGSLAGQDLNPSTGVVLTDTVVRLQMEIEELRSDSMCNQTGDMPSPLSEVQKCRPGCSLPDRPLYCRICFRSVRPRNLRAQPHTGRRDWTAVLCFSSGKMGHGATRRYVSILAARMEGREGWERICFDLSSCGGGAPPGGKWRLIPGFGGETWLSASREQPNPRVIDR